MTVAALLLFVRLGHHALWDDEAYTALTGEGVERTGDTSVLLGHNVFAWADGSTLRNLHDRFFPPLPAYLAGASMRVLGDNALAARLPFAACGLLTFCVLLAWLRIDRVDPWTAFICLFLLLINVSLILFLRQCRYYAVSVLLCAFIAELYVHHLRSIGGQVMIIIAMAALFATQYFCFGAIVVVGCIDYAIWGRGQNPIGWRRAVVCGAILAGLIAAQMLVWSPFGPHATVLAAAPGTISDDICRLWWNLRDTHVNEFWNLALLVATPVVAGRKRDHVLWRGLTAFVAYFLIVTAVSPHGSGKIGEVRYFCALIPLACFLEARTLRQLFPTRPLNAFLVAAALFGTNLFSFGPFTALGSFPIPIRSTIVAYVHDLITPPNDPYRLASEWLHQNIPPERSMLVLPEYSTYPLMFHAPSLIYAWQLTDPPAEQFRALPAINFRGRVAPDYIAIFGEQGRTQLDAIGELAGNYSHVETLPVFAKDAYRPELFLRMFDQPPAPSPGESIEILQYRPANADTLHQ